MLTSDLLQHRFLRLCSQMLLTVWAVASICAPAVWAHPFHISTAEMELSERGDRFEVGLKVQAADMEKLLSNLLGRRVDLETSAGLDEPIEAYLASHFRLLSARELAAELAAKKPAGAVSQRASESAAKPVGSKKTVKLVGRELEKSWVWLYFEVPLPKVDGELQLLNSILVDVNAGQINTTTLRQGQKRFAIRTTRKQPAAKFDRSWLTRASPANRQLQADDQ